MSPSAAPSVDVWRSRVEVWKADHEEAMSVRDVEDRISGILHVADRLERTRQAQLFCTVHGAKCYYEILEFVKVAASEVESLATVHVRDGYEVDGLSDLSGFLLRTQAWEAQIEEVKESLSTPARTLEDILNGNSGIRP